MISRAAQIPIRNRSFPLRAPSTNSPATTNSHLFHHKQTSNPQLSTDLNLTNRHSNPKTAPKMATTRSLYRSLLRELPPRPLLSTPRAPLHQRLRENFQQQQQSTGAPTAAPTPTAELRAAQAEQYVAYLRAQRTYVTLLERYNPGMGMDEEERVRLTARRVGMDLPVEYDLEAEGEAEGEGRK